jgi:orotate phosphoribosyltransferase
VNPIADLVESSGAIRRGDIALSDGTLIDYYVDTYAFETEPAVLAEVASATAAALAEGGPVDVLAGPALGAVPLLTAVSLETGHRTAFVRNAVRHRGTQARIEGEISKGDRVVVLDDVAMTGETVVETASVVENAGGAVERVLVVVDRDEGAAERATAAGYEFDYLARVGDEITVGRAGDAQQEQ